MALPENKDEFPGVSRLGYRKGDLIMKQGDYGVSIYMVVSGRVQVYTEVGERETPLATLGPGDMMGEMIFLSRDPQRRSASARALEECELELLHPTTLAREYDQMPAIVKLIADQSTRRLLRMNRLVAKLSLARDRQGKKVGVEGKAVNRRAHYRRKASMPATFRPANESSPQANLVGEIRDIGLGGIGVEIRPRMFSEFNYPSGAEFRMETRLPNNKPLSFKAKLVWMRQGCAPGTHFLGMSYSDLPEACRKDLGFFMMAGN